ncbi:DUF6382 domain-containing protein [Candidatus Soleaferrea massiliensis]|uniref:DUF6382 domain-containing protein n=1 Tax=Candidatus Soleaferrea massiliensis TaxID=1470354 RepID=UPI00058FCF52|nr:DUF6382 domain-containing protein [Candidatus Soleaferrea massiliensis]
MKDFYFENRGSSSFLVYQIGESDRLDSFTLGMLTNNTIAHFASAVFVQQDTDRFMKYNVTAKISVRQLISGTVRRRHLLGVLSGIVSAVLSAEEYMIDACSLVFDLDRIFVDVSSGETCLICLPLVGESKDVPDLKSFIKEIIFSAQFDQAANNDYIAKIFNHLNSTPAFSITEFKRVLDEIESTADDRRAFQQAASSRRPAAQHFSGPDGTDMPQGAVYPAVQQFQQPVQPMQGKSPQQPRAAVQPHQAPPRQNPQAHPISLNKTAEPKQEAEEPEKGMSWLYLMQHYNKENAAAYKAQKQQRKSNGKKCPAPAARNGSKTPMAAPQAAGSAAQKKPVQAAGYAVPSAGGQPVGYAVPSSPIQPGSPAQKKASMQPNAAASPRKHDNSSDTRQASFSPQPQNPAETQVNWAAAQSAADFGETVVLGGNTGETTVLLSYQQPDENRTPYLICLKNSERIPLNKPVFRIGKERSYVDYFISNNTAISRSHANIVTREGRFYIVDTNSTNHTYVNGEMIPSNMEKEIRHGMRIRFANEDFEFHEY